MNTDLYAGYEGYPEFSVELRRRGSVERTLRAWNGFLERALAHLEPGPDGWVGLALHYHMLTGWLEQPEWADPDPGGSRKLLEAARESCQDDETRVFIDAYIDILRDAIEGGGQIVLREE